MLKCHIKNAQHEKCSVPHEECYIIENAQQNGGNIPIWRTITKFATEKHLEMADLEIEKHEDHLMPSIDSAQRRRDCM